MSRSSRRGDHRAHALPNRRAAIAATTAAAFALGLVAVPGAAFGAAPTAAVPTRAALDPALSAGRGAAVNFLEQEAENAVISGGTVISGRAAYTLAAEASGRKAVTLSAGGYVEFTLPAATNAITVRYSLPDAPRGGGITSPLNVTVGGTPEHAMTLTSQYAWLYNQYSFSNDPTAAPIHPEWWITERDAWFGTGVTIPFRPMHFYDEQRMLLSQSYAAGQTIRLSVPAGAAATTIDLIDTELVAPPRPQAADEVSLAKFSEGAPSDSDIAKALEKTITYAKQHHLAVYVPAGTYHLNRHILVDDVTITGAGNWYTIFQGQEVTLGQPLPDKSIHTGVGFYGKYVADGGSSNVHLSGFAIEGDVRERIDTDQVNGIGGSLSDSSVDSLYIQHTKVGMWLDGPMHNLSITNDIIVDQIADGINFHTGVTNSTVSNTFVRNTGDDGLAMWSENVEDAHDTFDHNTVQTPSLANDIAIYGGTDNTVSNNLVADPIREGSGLHAGSRFGALAFTDHLWFTNNTVVRAGTYELNWNIGLGAIWFLALEKNMSANIEVVGDNFLDSTYYAIMFVADFPVKDQYSITNVHFKDIHVDGTGASVVNARAAGNATFQNVDVRHIGWWGVNNCGTFHFTAAGSEFSLTDLGGNDGFDTTPWRGTTGPWLAPYVPNTLLCEDRPPVTAPPAPSAW